MISVIIRFIFYKKCVCDLVYKSSIVRRISVVLLLFLMGRETEIGIERSSMALPCSSMMTRCPPCSFVMTKSMWYYNLESEFKLICSVIVLYSFISMVTEFPSIVFKSHLTFRQPKITTQWWNLTWTVCTSSKWVSPFQMTTTTFQPLEPPTLHLRIQFMWVRCDTPSSCSSLHRPPSTLRHVFW